MLDKFYGHDLLIYKYLWFKNSNENVKKIITYISNFTKTDREKVLSKILIPIPVPLVENLKFKINNNIKKILIIGTSENKNIKKYDFISKNMDIKLTIIGEMEEI